MTDTSNPEFVYLDDILGEGYADIEHEDGACSPRSSRDDTLTIV